MNEMLARRTGSDTDPMELPPGLPLSIVTSLKVRYRYSPRITPADRAKMDLALENRPPVTSKDEVTSIRIEKLNPSLFEILSGYSRLRIAGPLEQ